jgi:tryptophan halogenase
MKERKRLAIIGAGSSGIMSACHFNTWLGDEWSICTIHNPEKDILGIGESTNPSFLDALEKATGFCIYDDLHKLNGTIKIGTRYIDWRPTEFINPLIGAGVAVHMDTYSLKEFAIPRLLSNWVGKYSVLEGDVGVLQDKGDRVIVQIDDKYEEFDYVIDCRGTPKAGSEGICYIEDHLLNHCLVHNVKCTEDSLSARTTGHIATIDGWMFEVPLKTRTSYGYLFNTNITKVEDAHNNFKKILGIEEGEDLDPVQFSFTPYYRNTIVENRLIYNGNSAAFFEPMFANSIWMYNEINKETLDYIMGYTSETTANKNIRNKILSVKNCIAIHYVNGSTEYTSEFWKSAETVAIRQLAEEDGQLLLHTIKKALKHLKTNKSFATCPGTEVFNPHAWRILLHNLGEQNE